MFWLKQSTSVVVPFGPMVDATDGVTLEAGLATAMDNATTGLRLKKNGAAFVDRNDATAPAYDAMGVYNITLDATDTGTLGTLRVVFEESATCVPHWEDFMVIPANAYDALVGGTDVLNADVTQWLGTAVATPTTAGVPEVDTTHVGGTLQTAGDIPALVTTVDTVVDGIQADLDNGTDGLGAIKADTAAVKTKTDFLPSATAGAAGGVFIAGTNAATVVTTSFTTTFTGNLTGSVGGNVDGNVAGSVGSLVGHTVQTGDNFARLGAPAGASVSADIAAVKAETNTIASNTADNVVELAILTRGHIEGVAQTGTLSTTQATSDLTGYAADSLIGRTLIWDSGGATHGEATTITDYTDTNGLITFNALTAAPANNDAFKIIPSTPTTGTADAVWDEVLSGATHNVTNSAGRRLRALQDFSVYEGGYVWVDTVNGASGVTDFENGTVNNPVDTIGEALTIAASVGLPGFHILPGSSITLAASMANYEIVGHNYTLALGGQAITNAYISGATVSGTFTGATAILEDCIINAITGPGMTLRRCFFNDVTITNNGTDGWAMNDCRSRVAGTNAPNFDFGAAVANTNVTLRNYMGGIEIENIGASGTDNLSIDGMGQMILNANCAGGTIALRGIFSVTDNASGAVNLVRQDPTSDQVHQGKAQAGTANTITLAASASATNGAYDPGTIQILTGPGAGETRGILGYDGTTKVASVDKDWRTTPTSASSYVVYSSGGKGHVNEGLAQAGAASTITLNSVASATDDIYVGQAVLLVGGTGQDQSRIVTAYNGTTKVATVHKAWDTQPDSTTSYIMSPLPANGDTLESLSTTVGAAGSGLTEAGGTGDQFTGLPEVQADVNKINGVVITGDGSATPFDV